MKQPVLFVILDRFADWECAFLTTALQGRIMDRTSPYEVKTVSTGKESVKSIGGFTVVPDYSVENCPTNYAGLILVGAESWREKKAHAIIPLIHHAMANEKLIGAICDATVFLGMNGFLNGKKHTSNSLEDLAECAQEQYTGKKDYQLVEAVRDGNLITANGTGYLEFTREVLTALDAYPPEYIENNYQFFKHGYIEFIKNLPK